MSSGGGMGWWGLEALGGRQEICGIYSLICLGTSLSAKLQTVVEGVRAILAQLSGAACDQINTRLFLPLSVSLMASLGLSIPLPPACLLSLILSASPVGAKSMSPEAD